MGWRVRGGERTTTVKICNKMYARNEEEFNR